MAAVNTAARTDVAPASIPIKFKKPEILGSLERPEDPWWQVWLIQAIINDQAAIDLANKIASNKAGNTINAESLLESDLARFLDNAQDNTVLNALSALFLLNVGDEQTDKISTIKNFLKNALPDNTILEIFKHAFNQIKQGSGDILLRQLAADDSDKTRRAETHASSMSFVGTEVEIDDTPSKMPTETTSVALLHESLAQAFSRVLFSLHYLYPYLTPTQQHFITSHSASQSKLTCQAAQLQLCQQASTEFNVNATALLTELAQTALHPKQHPECQRFQKLENIYNIHIITAAGELMVQADDSKSTTTAQLPALETFKHLATPLVAETYVLNLPLTTALDTVPLRRPQLFSLENHDFLYQSLLKLGHSLSFKNEHTAESLIAMAIKQSTIEAQNHLTKQTAHAEKQRLREATYFKILVNEIIKHFANNLSHDDQVNLKCQLIENMTQLIRNLRNQANKSASPDNKKVLQQAAEVATTNTLNLFNGDIPEANIGKIIRALFLNNPDTAHRYAMIRARQQGLFENHTQTRVNLTRYSTAVCSDIKIYPELRTALYKDVVRSTLYCKDHRLYELSHTHRNLDWLRKHTPGSVSLTQSGQQLLIETTQAYADTFFKKPEELDSSPESMERLITFFILLEQQMQVTPSRVRQAYLRVMCNLLNQAQSDLPSSAQYTSIIDRLGQSLAYASKVHHKRRSIFACGKGLKPEVTPLYQTVQTLISQRLQKTNRCPYVFDNNQRIKLNEFKTAITQYDTSDAHHRTLRQCFKELAAIIYNTQHIGANNINAALEEIITDRAKTSPAMVVDALASLWLDIPGKPNQRKPSIIQSLQVHGTTYQYLDQAYKTALETLKQHYNTTDSPAPTEVVIIKKSEGAITPEELNTLLMEQFAEIKALPKGARSTQPLLTEHVKPVDLEINWDQLLQAPVKHLDAIFTVINHALLYNTQSQCTDKNEFRAKELNCDTYLDVYISYFKKLLADKPELNLNSLSEKCRNLGIFLSHSQMSSTAVLLNCHIPLAIQIAQQEFSNERRVAAEASVATRGAAASRATVKVLTSTPARKVWQQSRSTRGDDPSPDDSKQTPARAPAELTA